MLSDATHCRQLGWGRDLPTLWTALSVPRWLLSPPLQSLGLDWALPLTCPPCRWHPKTVSLWGFHPQPGPGRGGAKALDCSVVLGRGLGSLIPAVGGSAAFFPECKSGSTQDDRRAGSWTWHLLLLCSRHQLKPPRRKWRIPPHSSRGTKTACSWVNGPALWVARAPAPSRPSACGQEDISTKKDSN